MSNDVTATRDRGNPALRALTGVGLTLGAVIAGALPVVVMLLAPPRGSPFPLGDLTMVGIFAGSGVLIGLAAIGLQRGVLRSLLAAPVVLLIAFWLSSTVWPSMSGLPTPPLLPTVPATTTLLAGILVGVLLRRGGRAPAGGLVLGLVAAGGVLLVTELEGWGRRTIQSTFAGPLGMSPPTWLAVVFVLTVLAGVLVGVVLAVRDRIAAVVALVALAVPVAAIALVAELGGQPRTTRYGLVLGVLLVALLRAPVAGAGAPADDAEVS